MKVITFVICNLLLIGCAIHPIFKKNFSVQLNEIELPKYSIVQDRLLISLENHISHYEKISSQYIDSLGVIGYASFSKHGKDTVSMDLEIISNHSHPEVSQEFYSNIYSGFFQYKGINILFKSDSFVQLGELIELNDKSEIVTIYSLTVPNKGESSEVMNVRFTSVSQSYFHEGDTFQSFNGFFENEPFGAKKRLD